MRRAHPFAAEVLAAVVCYGLATLSLWSAIYYNRHGAGHWVDYGVGVAFSTIGYRHLKVAWLMYRNGVEAHR